MAIVLAYIGAEALAAAFVIPSWSLTMSKSPAPRVRRVISGAILSLSAAALGGLHSARAEPPPAPPSTVAATAVVPDEEDRKAAGSAFENGERLFAKGDYLLAAASFEEAYARVPHDSSLWNAARSWQKAGEIDRAANRYTHFLADAPADTPDRDEAIRALREIAAKLGRFDVQAPGLTSVTMDGAAVRLPTVYAHPGAHVWSARAGDRVVQRTERVEAGSAVSIVLAAEPPATASASPGPPAAPLAPAVVTVVLSSAPSAVGPPRITAPRAATIVMGGVSALLLGLTIASGIDTLQSRNAYELAQTDGDRRRIYAEGVGKQLRTNVLIGVTLGAGVLTGLGLAWIIVAERPDGAPRGAAGASIAVAGGF